MFSVKKRLKSLGKGMNEKNLESMAFAWLASIRIANKKPHRKTKFEDLRGNIFKFSQLSKFLDYFPHCKTYAVNIRKINLLIRFLV